MPTISRRKPKTPLAARTRRTLPTLPETRPASIPKGKTTSIKSKASKQGTTKSSQSAKNGRNNQSSKKNSKQQQQNKTTTSRKRFRRVKVLRWWVLPTIFFVPLGILWMEYYIGKLISIDDVKDVYYQQLGIDPFIDYLETTTYIIISFRKDCWNTTIDSEYYIYIQSLAMFERSKKNVKSS